MRSLEPELHRGISSDRIMLAPVQPAALTALQPQVSYFSVADSGTFPGLLSQLVADLGAPRTLSSPSAQAAHPSEKVTEKKQQPPSTAPSNENLTAALALNPLVGGVLQTPAHVTAGLVAFGVRALAHTKSASNATSVAVANRRTAATNTASSAPASNHAAQPTTAFLAAANLSSQASIPATAMSVATKNSVQEMPESVTESISLDNSQAGGESAAGIGQILDEAAVRLAYNGTDVPASAQVTTSAFSDADLSALDPDSGDPHPLPQANLANVMHAAERSGPGTNALQTAAQPAEAFIAIAVPAVEATGSAVTDRSGFVADAKQTIPSAENFTAAVPHSGALPQDFAAVRPQVQINDSAPPVQQFHVNTPQTQTPRQHAAASNGFGHPVNSADFFKQGPAVPKSDSTAGRPGSTEHPSDTTQTNADISQRLGTAHEPTAQAQAATQLASEAAEIGTQPDATNSLSTLPTTSFATNDPTVQPKSVQAVPSDITPAASAEIPMQVQSARIFQNANVAEMRLGLLTDAFGAVQVHTTVSDKQVELALGSERGDLRSSLGSELQTLQYSLQQHDLRLEQLRVLTHVPASAADFSSGADPQQQPFRRYEQRSAAQDDAQASQDEEIVTESANGLNVRA